MPDIDFVIYLKRLKGEFTWIVVPELLINCSESRSEYTKFVLYCFIVFLEDLGNSLLFIVLEIFFHKVINF